MTYLSTRIDVANIDAVKVAVVRINTFLVAIYTFFDEFLMRL